MEKCNICPRQCNANRNIEKGLCHALWNPVVHGSMVHRGEEACISGIKGSGTVFFMGCNLNCVFCQNYDISQNTEGTAVTPERLSKIFLDMEKKVFITLTW